jgi:hypothetical protein
MQQACASQPGRLHCKCIEKDDKISCDIGPLAELIKLGGVFRLSSISAALMRHRGLQRWLSCSPVSSLSVLAESAESQGEFLVQGILLHGASVKPAIP